MSHPHHGYNSSKPTHLAQMSCSDMQKPVDKPDELAPCAHRQTRLDFAQTDTETDCTEPAVSADSVRGLKMFG